MSHGFQNSSDYSILSDRFDHHLDTGMPAANVIWQGLTAIKDEWNRPRLESFGNDFLGDFVSDGRLWAFGAGANGTVHFREDKINRLVDLLEKVAFEDLVGRDGTGNLGAVEVHATQFGTGECALRIVTE